MTPEESLSPMCLVDQIKQLQAGCKGQFGFQKTLRFVKAFLRNVETVEAFAIQERDTWVERTLSLNNVVVSSSLLREKVLITLQYQYFDGKVTVHQTGYMKFPLLGHRCYIQLNRFSIDLNSRNLQIPQEKLPLLLNNQRLAPLIKVKLQGLL